MSAEAIEVAMRNGWLHRLYRGVYAFGHRHLPTEAWFLAATKAGGPNAVLSHFSAAALWGIVDWDGRAPEITLVGPSASARPGLHAHRTARLEVDEVRRRQGIRVTSPARTLIDLASQLSARQLRRAVRRAQGLGLVTLAELVSALARVGPRRGTRKLRAIIADGPAPTRSELENVVLDLILRGGFTPPDVNVALVIGGRKLVPDFRWPDEHVVVEADGRAWHDNKVAREDDAERQAVLEAHGERVIRVTWQQAVRRPDETLRRLRAAGLPMRRALS
jgi:hypothetical protein